MVNPILTDDELIDAIRKAGLRVIGPHKSLSRAVEAAVLAKLARQADRQRVPAEDSPAVCDAYERIDRFLRNNLGDEDYADYSHDLDLLVAAPEAPAQASAVDDDYKGWYCAHCQRGVDAREVTYSEQHEACGRFITHDRPPKVEASAVDERAAFAAWVADYALRHEPNYSKATEDDCWAAWQARAALAQKGGK
jgi:hypothetical protein